MNRRNAGVTSILLILAAVLVGAEAMAKVSISFAVEYLAGSAFLGTITVAAFCTKCPEKGERCVHILPGKIAAVLPERKPGPYSPIDLAGVGIPALVVVLAPQYWLTKSPVLFLVFWVFAAGGLFLIRTDVCTGCGNRQCPMKKENPSPGEREEQQKKGRK